MTLRMETQKEQAQAQQGGGIGALGLGDLHPARANDKSEALMYSLL